MNKKFFAFALPVVLFLTACGAQSSNSGLDNNALSYTDAAYKFSFSYPADWKVTPVTGANDPVPVAHLKSMQVGKITGANLNASPSYVAVVLGTDIQKIVQDLQSSDVVEMGTQQSSGDVPSTQEVSRNSNSGFKGQFKDPDGGTEYFYAFPVPNRNLMLYVQYHGLAGYNQTNEAMIDTIHFNS